MPPAKADEVRDALGQAERDLSIVADELVRATNDVLRGHRRGGRHGGSRRRGSDGPEEAARVALLAAIDALDRGEAEGRASWWAELADGAVAPFRGGTVSRERQMHVRGALNFLDQRRERMAAHRAETGGARRGRGEAPVAATTDLARAPVTADGPAR